MFEALESTGRRISGMETGIVGSLSSSSYKGFAKEEPEQVGEKAATMLSSVIVTIYPAFSGSFTDLWNRSVDPWGPTYPSLRTPGVDGTGNMDQGSVRLNVRQILMFTDDK